MTIRGLIFDFDGLILDTEGPEYAAWQSVFAEYGGHLPLDKWSLYMGTTAGAFDVVRYLEEGTGRQYDRQSLKRQFHNRFVDLLSVEVDRPGVREYLESARVAGLRVGLASSSDRKWVTGHLERLGLIGYFDTVCTADDVQRVKPDPELFRLAVARLELAPQETIVFEDSLNGLTAAKAAGCYCVVVPHAISTQLDFRAADRVISSMADVPLHQLLEEVNQALAE